MGIRIGDIDMHPAHDDRYMSPVGLCLIAGCDYEWTVDVPDSHIVNKHFPNWRTAQTTDELILDSLIDLHRKVDAIVTIVENTVSSLGNNPMMQMLSKLAPKAKG